MKINQRQAQHSTKLERKRSSTRAVEPVIQSRLNNLGRERIVTRALYLARANATRVFVLKGGGSILEHITARHQSLGRMTQMGMIAGFSRTSCTVATRLLA